MVVSTGVSGGRAAGNGGAKGLATGPDEAGDTQGWAAGWGGPATWPAEAGGAQGWAAGRGGVVAVRGGEAGGSGTPEPVAGAEDLEGVEGDPGPGPEVVAGGNARPATGPAARGDAGVDDDAEGDVGPTPGAVARGDAGAGDGAEGDARPSPGAEARGDAGPVPGPDAGPAGRGDPGPVAGLVARGDAGSVDRGDPGPVDRGDAGADGPADGGTGPPARGDPEVAGRGGGSVGWIGRSLVVVSAAGGSGGVGGRRASVMREVVPGRCSPVIPVSPLVSTMPVTLRAVPPGTGTQGLPTRKPVWQARAMTPRAADRARYDRATAHLDAPVAIVDLEAFDDNAADLVRRAGGKPIRVASKSVRCRALLERVLAREGFAGIMSFTLDESLWLARAGFEDVLLAYPSADRAGFGELARDPKLAAAVTVMVDDVAQLDLIDAARAGGTEEVRVCLELDTALSLLGGRIRVGARRSPLREPAQLAELARSVARRPGFRLVGIMAYEGHVAGVGDAVAGRPLRSRAIRLMQAAARRELAERRAAVVRAVRAVAPDLEFVNGGGTGSVQHTAAEEAVTEIAAGSGLFVPRLFDNYTSFTGRPAALFAQPVVRRPGVGVVTVLGGGYPASGAAGPDRLPVPYLPEGLRYDPQEGPGEVQTPLLGSPADDLRIGDKVWFRHAKAGELCERFASLQLVEGDRITATVPTYRGEGQTFL